MKNTKLFAWIRFMNVSQVYWWPEVYFYVFLVSLPFCHLCSKFSYYSLISAFCSILFLRQNLVQIIYRFLHQSAQSSGIWEKLHWSKELKILSLNFLAIDNILSFLLKTISHTIKYYFYFTIFILLNTIFSWLKKSRLSLTLYFK